MMSRNDKTDTSGENPAVSDYVQTTAEITEIPTESETKTTTTVTTTPVKSTTQTTISDQYTSDEISDVFSAPTETYAFYGIVATENDRLNLRDKPSTDSNVIEQLSKGTKASVYYVDGYPDWYKVYPK